MRSPGRRRARPSTPTSGAASAPPGSSRRSRATRAAPRCRAVRVLPCRGARRSIRPLRPAIGLLIRKWARAPAAPPRRQGWRRPRSVSRSPRSREAPQPGSALRPTRRGVRRSPRPLLNAAGDHVDSSPRRVVQHSSAVAIGLVGGHHRVAVVPVQLRLRITRTASGMLGYLGEGIGMGSRPFVRRPARSRSSGARRRSCPEFGQTRP
jgi:hypothetical protein